MDSKSFDQKHIDRCQFQKYDNQKIEFNELHDLAVFKLSDIADLDQAKQMVLLVDFKYFKEVSYFSKDSEGNIRVAEKLFRKKATKNRIFSSEHFVFNFDSLAQNHYIIIKNNLAVPALIKLVNKDEYIEFDRNIVLFFTILYTSMFGLFLVNFIFYLYIKNKTYLFYSIFIISALNTIFWFEGRYIDFGLFSISDFVAQINQYSFLFSNAILYIFLLYFLKLNNRKTIEGKIIFWLIVHVLVQLVLLLLFDFLAFTRGVDFLSDWNNLTVQIANLIILLVAWKVYKNGNRQAGFLLISWSLFIALSSMRLLFVLNPAPNHFWMQHAHEIGVLIDAFVLAFALADQSLIYKKSSETAQFRYLKANRALLGETLINNFLHQIKEEILRKKDVQGYIFEIENKFAQMIVKYAPMDCVKRLSVLDNSLEIISIFENKKDCILKEYINTNNKQLCDSCSAQKLYHQIETINERTCQFILIPLIKHYQNKKYDHECLLIQIHHDNFLEVDEINDLVEFIDNSLQALIDSKALKDITKHAQDVMTISKEKEKAMKLKDRFFANVSHEFRTPLSLTIAPLQDLSKQKEFLNTSGKYLVETALTNAQDLLRLVDSVLDIQKLEANIFPLQVSKVNLNKLIYAEIKRLMNWALDKNQNLTFNKVESDAYIYCDNKEIRKIISNLISNAIKYCGEDANITLSIVSKEPWIKVFIVDDGRGIEEEIQEKIFDRYYQGQSIQHALEAGSGIGLSFVKDIMKLHSGYVTLESQINKGTTFTLWFKKGFEHFDYDDLIIPQDKDKFKQKKSKYKITSQNNNTNKNKPKNDVTTLLIVEDNSELRKYLTFKLSDKFTIIQAENGVVGLDKAGQYLPDLIISDVMMPEMDGIEMVNSIRKDKMLEAIPVIMLTAKTQKSDTILGLKTGADDYISKPFDFEELEARINRLIDSRKIISKQINHKYKDNSKVIKSSFQDKLDEMILEHISHDNLNVDFLAEKLFINRSSLYRKIKKEFQLTPIAYIRKIRMNHALNLLKNKKLTVSETAYACGYESLSYFSKQFKQTYGKSPSDVL